MPTATTVWTRGAAMKLTMLAMGLAAPLWAIAGPRAALANGRAAAIVRNGGKASFYLAVDCAFRSQSHSAACGWPVDSRNSMCPVPDNSKISTLSPAPRAART